MANHCSCGAPMAVHPVAGYSAAGACLQALEAATVKVMCDWPSCEKRVRKTRLGTNFCQAHRRLEHDAFMSLMRREGPSTLSRPTPTVAELAEFVATGEIPASRRAPVTFATTKTQCAACGGPLVVVNDPDWSPDLPNAMSVRSDGQAWGMGICRVCSFRANAATA